MEKRLRELLAAARANLKKYEGDPRAMRAGKGMVADLERELRRALEAGVTGTVYNPSDSDMTPGRIGYSDMLHAKGEAVAREWESLNT